MTWHIHWIRSYGLGRSWAITPIPGRQISSGAGQRRSSSIAAGKAANQRFAPLWACMKASIAGPSFGLVIAPTQDQSSELMLKFDEFRGAVELPSDYLSTDTKLAVRFANGNRFIARPGSEKSARSFSAVTLLLEDEASQSLGRSL